MHLLICLAFGFTWEYDLAADKEVLEHKVMEEIQEVVYDLKEILKDGEE